MDFVGLHKKEVIILFWDNFVAACEKSGKSPSVASEELGFNRSAVTAWKNGALPQVKNRKKIADYFGITVEELMGTKKEPAGDGGLELDEKRMEAVKLLQKLDSEQVDAFITLLKSKSTEKD